MKNYSEVAEVARSDLYESVRGHPPGAADLVVRKYGGSSLATVELIRGVAREIATLAGTGKRVVVVVSARGDTTDELVALARQFTERPDPRELDQLMATGEQASAALLALALVQLGTRAVSLSGDQAGIVTGATPGAAAIRRVDATRVFRRMRENQVVVVAGFQGRDADGELRTLGRGGSDTTAVALAAALGDRVCEICTDVQGIRTADPRTVGNTRLVPSISYGAMAQLAAGGAQVLHARSVDLAARRGVPIRVLHSSRPGTGTTVSSSLESVPEVIGIAHERRVRLVRLQAEAAPPGRCAAVLAELIAKGTKPDVLTWHDPGDLRFTVHGPLTTPIPLYDTARERGVRCRIDDNLGSVSVVGTGLLDDSRFLTELFRVVSEPAIAMATSPTRLTAVLPAARVAPAVRSLHHAFRLDQPVEARR